MLVPCLAAADGMVRNPWGYSGDTAPVSPDTRTSDTLKDGGVITATSAKPLKRGDAAPIAATPMTPFADTRLVLFHYDPDLTYGVKTKEGLYTHIEIARDDTIKGFYLSDALKWKFHISGDKRRLFIKPAFPGQFTSGTLVTSQRQ